MPSTKVNAATVVLAGLRERVAMLHAAAGGDTVVDPPDPDHDVATPPTAGGSSTDDVPDTAALHAATVGLRDFARGFAGLLDPDAVTGLGEGLDEALAVVSPAHDLDETVDAVDDLLDDVDASLVLGPVATRLDIVATDRRAQVRSAVGAMLADPGWSSTLAAADGLVLTGNIDGPGPKHTAEFFARTVAEADAALREALLQLADATDDPARDRGHRAVVNAARRLEVTARCAHAVHGKKARKLADAAADLRARVDEHVHARASARWIVDIADLAHRAGEPGFTYGLLHADATARRQRTADLVSTAERAYRKPKLRHWLLSAGS